MAKTKKGGTAGDCGGIKPIEIKPIGKDKPEKSKPPKKKGK